MKKARFFSVLTVKRRAKTPFFLLRSGLGSHPKNPLFSFLELPLSSGNSSLVYHIFRVLSNVFSKKWLAGGVRMPVFRGFSEVKGVKIPKIVTYHTTVKTIFMHRFGAIFRREKRGRNTSRKGGVTDVMQQALRKFFERGFSELEKEKKQTAKRGLNLCRNRLRKDF